MIAKIERGTIVVPWSFSNPSGAALEWALCNVEDDSFIRVVHVATPLSAPDNGVLYESAEQQNQLDLEIRFRQQVPCAEGARNIKFSVLYGNVCREIVRFAACHQAKIIVMGPTKKKGISKFCFRYLTERIVRIASCPVLVLQGTKSNKPKRNRSWRPNTATSRFGLPL